jgi:hypothetical protein
MLASHQDIPDIIAVILADLHAMASRAAGNSLPRGAMRLGERRRVYHSIFSIFPYPHFQKWYCLALDCTNYHVILPF